MARRSLRAFWYVASRLAVAGLLLLATYSSLGQYYAPYAEANREAVLEFLGSKLGVHLAASHLKIGWQRLSPVIELRDLEVAVQQSDTPLITVEEVVSSVNILASLRDQDIRLDHLQVRGVNVSAPTQRQPADNKTKTAASSWRDSWHRFLATLDYADSVSVLDSYADTPIGILQLDVQLGRSGDFRRIAGVLKVNGSPLQLLLESRGPFTDAKRLRVSAYLKALNIDVEKLQLSQLLSDAPVPEHVSASSEIWLDWHPAKGIDARGRLSVPKLNIAKLLPNIASLQRDFENTQLNFVGHYSNPQEWELTLRDSEFTFGKRVAVPAFKISYLKQTDRPILDVIAPEIDVPAVVAFVENLALPNAEKLTRILREAKLQGHVEHLRATIPLKTPLHTKLQAHLRDFSMAAVVGAPGLRNLSGWLEGRLDDGTIDLLAEQPEMLFPTVYPHWLKYQTIKGRLAWSFDNDFFKIRSGLFKALGEEGEVSGYFGLNVPLKKELGDPEMDLVLGLPNSDVKYVARYLPKFILPNLRTWLDEALLAGHIKQAMFLYHGSIKKSSGPADLSWQVAADFDNARLFFAPGWEPLEQMDGRLMIDNGAVYASPARGQLYGANFRDAAVGVHRVDQGDIQLSVEADLQGEAPNLLKLFRESPLQKHIAPALAGWGAAGDFDGHLQLSLPLKASLSNRDINVDVQGSLKDVSAKHEGARLRFANIHGPVSYNSTQGLFSPRDLDAMLWQAPVKVRVQSQPVAEVLIPQVQVSGALEMAALREWLQLGFLSLANGRAPVVANVQTNELGTFLTVDSSLQGIAIDVPGELAKSAEQERPLHLRFDLKPGEQFMNIAVGGNVQIRSRYQDFSHQGTLVAVDRDVAELALPETGVLLTGSVGVVDILAWQNTISALQQASDTGGDGHRSVKLGIRDLAIGRIESGEKSLVAINVDAEQTTDGWLFKLKNAALQGELELFNDERAPRVALDYLYLHKLIPSDEQSEDESRAEDWLQRINPADIPALKVSVAELKTGEKDWGAWSFSLSPIAQGVEVKELKGALSNIQIGTDEQPAQLRWQHRPDGDQSGFYGSFTVGDIRQEFERWGYQPLLSSKSVRFDVALDWDGLPNALDLKDATGSVGMHAKNGTFLTATRGARNMLQITNVFNIEALVRRLRLDFSDLTSEGINYDRIDGIVSVADQRIEVVDNIEIKGPSSEFRISGSADLASRQVDADFVAILPVTGNISLLTAATASLPAALGVVVVSKLFKKQLDQLSSVVYHVSGDWEEPEIRFHKLFDVGKRPSDK